VGQVRCALQLSKNFLILQLHPRRRPLHRLKCVNDKILCKSVRRIARSRSQMFQPDLRRWNLWKMRKPTGDWAQQDATFFAFDGFPFFTNYSLTVLVFILGRVMSRRWEFRDPRCSLIKTSDCCIPPAIFTLVSRPLSLDLGASVREINRSGDRCTGNASSAPALSTVDAWVFAY
jgi:hypothetical protein